jgi:DME family drug/metabolite transporter
MKLEMEADRRETAGAAGDAARRGVVYVLAAATLMGTSGTAASFASATAGPVSVGAARLVVGGLGLLLALPFLGGRRPHVLRLWRTRIGAAAGLATALYQVAFFGGVALAGVALGTLLTIGAAPLFAGLLSWSTLGERPRAAWWASTAICVPGLALLSLDGTSRVGVEPLGIAVALAAALLYAGYTVAARQLMRRGATSAEAMATGFGLGGLLMVPVLIAGGIGWLVGPAGLGVALWLGLGTVTLGYTLFGRGLRVLPAGPVTTLMLAEPLVAAILGVAILGEALGPAGWAGVALVASGLALQGRSLADGT